MPPIIDTEQLHLDRVARKSESQEHMSGSRPTKAFISGPLDVSTAYFDRYYKPRISEAIKAGHSFVIGPVSGIDALALVYLLSQKVESSRVHIYMASFEIASRPKFVKELEAELGKDRIVEAKKENGEDADTTWDRDAAMTRASDYDILRFRTELEQKSIYGATWRPRVSNTERNWRRRQGVEGMEDREVEYRRHIGQGEQKVQAVKSWTGSKKWLKNIDVEECDRTCDAHRDVVTLPLMLGKQAFGFGNDGARTA